MHQNGVDPGPQAGSLSPQKYLITWDAVPPDIALFAAPLSVTADRSLKNKFKKTWSELISDIRTFARCGKPQEKVDLELRAAGYCATLDYTLLKLSGFDQKQIRDGDAYYFPHIPYSVQEAPSPEIAQAKLLALMEHPEQALEEVPEQFREPRTTDALRSRAITLLSEYKDSPQIRAILQREFVQARSPASQLAAGAAILETNSDGAVTAWARTQEPRVALALLSGYEMETIYNTDLHQGGIFFARVATGGRSIDDLALSVVADPGHKDLFETAVQVLAARIDNPRIKDFITSTIASTNDPAIAAAIFTSTAPLGNDPAYMDAIRRWIASSDKYAQLSALMASGTANLPDQLQLAAPFLAMDDPYYVTRGLDSVSLTGARDPQLVLKMLDTIPQAARGNRQVQFYMNQVRMSMNSYIQDPKQVENGIAEAVKQGIRPIPQ